MRRVVAFFLLTVTVSLHAGMVLADDAVVLPKGVWQARLDSQLFLPFHTRYNKDGNVEDAATDFNTNLNSSVFPPLGALEPAFGMPPGTATFGRSVVSFDYHVTKVALSLQRGLTERLSVGIILPYYWSENNVSASLNTANATVGKNPAYLPTGGLAPIGTPGTVPLTTADIQAMLGPGLVIIPGGPKIGGYGYKPIESWSGQGIGDIEVGGRYQYYNSINWRLAFTGGVRLPTGETDDPDNLIDYRPVDGVWALLFRLNNDYIGIKDTVLNATLRYDLTLPDKKEVRVLDDPHNPIVPASNKENVDRNLGDVFEIELSGKYYFYKGASVSALYKYGTKTKDKVSGNRGLSYGALEDETDWSEQVYIVGLSYSTVSLYQEKKFSVPMEAYINYRNRFAGKNNLFNTEYIGLGLSIYF